MFQPIPTHLRPLALAIAISFPFSASASSVGSALEAGTVWYVPPNTAITPPTASSFSSSASYSANYYSSASSATAASDGSGHFGATTSAVHDLYYDPSKAYSKSTLTFLDSFTNTTGTTQSANFGININTLAFSLNTGWLGDNSATFSARVYVNGALTPTWESTANLLTSTNRFNPTYHESFTTGGTAPLIFTGGTAVYLDDTRGYAYTYSLASPFSTVLDLGSVAAGDSMNVRYEIDLYAETYAYGGSVSIDFDDPSGLLHGDSPHPMSAGFALAQNVPAVPEPDSLAMLAVGLGIVGSMARRRNGRR